MAYNIDTNYQGLLNQTTTGQLNSFILSTGANPGNILTCLDAFGTGYWASLGSLGVTGITGTADQVLANGIVGIKQTGDVILTLPQSIGVTSNVTFGNITGTLLTASQPNITTLAGVTSMNSITVGSRTLSNLTTLTATNLIGTISTVAQPNITSLGTLNALRVSGAIYASDGTVASPSYAFTNSTNSGLYLSGTNQVSLASNGIQSLRSDSSGNIIIPGNLTVNGTSSIINSTVFQVVDNIALLGSANVADSLDLGLAIQYVSSGTKYGCFYREAGGTSWFLKDGLTVQPGNTVTGGNLAKLSLSSISLATGASTDYVLKSDSSGNASWAALSGIGVTSVLGTKSILVNGSFSTPQIGAISLTTAQSIETTATPRFNGMGLGYTAPSTGLLVLGQSAFSTNTIETNSGLTVGVSNRSNLALTGTYNTNTSGFASFTGLYVLPTFTLDAASSDLSSYFSGILINPTFKAPASTILSGIMTGLYIAPIINTNVGTINTVYGIYYDGGTAATGTVVSNYGLWVNNPVGGTFKYAAYFGGKVGINNSIPSDFLSIGTTSTSGGITLNNNISGYSPASLNYYEATSTGITFFSNSGGSTSSSITLFMTRIGRLITLTIQTFNVLMGAASDLITTFGGPIPDRFKPAYGFMCCAPIVSNNIPSTGLIWVTTAGNIRVYSNSAYGIFGGLTTNNGIINAAFSCSYII